MPDVREKLVELRSVLWESTCWGYDDITDTEYIDYEETAKNLIANGVTIQRWIPVTERLPEPLEDVLVYDSSDKYVSVAYMTRHQEWVGITMKSDVTHWMPLLEPPKGE